MPIKVLKHIWCRLSRTKPFREYNQTQSVGAQLSRDDQVFECEPLTSGEHVPETQREQLVREQILERFEKWLDHVLAQEKPVEGIADELLSELENESDQDDPGAPDNRCDLYSMWSAMTALTQEVKLQGRAFKHLSDNLDPLSGLGEPIEKVLKAHAEALSETRRMAGEARAARAEHENTLVQAAEGRARHEVLGVLLDIRDRLTRGLQPASESHRKLDEHHASNWLGKIFTKGDDRTGHMLEIVSALEQGYMLSLDRLDEAMQQFGVHEIVCEGQPFDPGMMRVVDVEETTEVPDGIVVEVYRAGYMLDSVVLHPAQVKVARAPMKTSNQQEVR